MRNFHEDTWQECTGRIIALTARLAMVGKGADGEPLRRLSDCAACIAAGDCMGAYACYHRVVSALMAVPARRISGDMFMDYLIYLAVECEHPFALSAASGRLDEAELAVFRGDLATLGSLAALDWRDISRLCAERQRDDKQKSRYASDDISRMSSAAWTGLDPRFVPKEKSAAQAPALPVLPAPRESEWLPWAYGEKGLRGEYAADEALEEIYLELMRSPDWRGSCEDIWNLFSQYGSGIFLKERNLAFANGKLAPLPENGETFAELSAQQAARHMLSDTVLDFMRGGVSAPVSLCGAPGSGRHSLARSMANEFPELRTVFVCAKDESLPALITHLGGQPLRFMLVADGAPNRDLTALCGPYGNILLLCISEDAGRGELCPTVIHLDKPDLDCFVKTINEFIAALDENCAADSAIIRSIALDCQINSRDCLNAAAAKLAAKRYVANKL